MNRFSSSKFWETVDGLSFAQTEKLILAVGGAAALGVKFANKRHNASKRRVSITLSELDYAALLYDAGITASDVKKGGYHLARVGDSGGLHPWQL